MSARIHRLAVAIATIAACSALAAPSVQSYLDASHSRLARGPDAARIALGDTADMHLAQTLTIEIGGNAMGVFLPVSCESGSLVVRLRDLDGEFPGSNILAQGELQAPAQPMDLHRNFSYVPFFVPVAAAANTQLAIEIEATGPCTFSAAPPGSDYGGGSGWFRSVFSDQTWVRLPSDMTGDDLPFQLLMEAAPPESVRPIAHAH